jgi:S1-C subfamily serine protease
MKASRVVAAAAAAALLGGAAGAATALIAGPDHNGKTVIVRESGSPSPQARLASAPVGRTRFDPARIYAARVDGVVTIYSYFGSPSVVDPHAAQGSGFVVSRSGLVLTDAHVITTAPARPARAAKQVYVEFDDGDRVPAHVVGYDLFSDVGVLRVESSAHRLSPVPLGNSARVAVGESVAAIGSPFGRQNSLSVGVVSGTTKPIASLTSDYDLPDAIQTDAPINRGNSGGPLFDAAGRVVGITAQIRSDSGLNQGVGFAVPINAARRAMRALVAHGRVRYAYVGVSTQDLIPAIARRLGYAAGYGAIVACVETGGPADRAGLHGGSGQRSVLGRPDVVQGGDVIVAVGGRRVQSGSDLIRIVSEKLRPGRRTVFTVMRETSRLRVLVVPVDRPAAPAAACTP